MNSEPLYTEKDNYYNFDVEYISGYFRTYTGYGHSDIDFYRHSIDCNKCSKGITHELKRITKSNKYKFVKYNSKLFDSLDILTCYLNYTKCPLMIIIENNINLDKYNYKLIKSKRSRSYGEYLYSPVIICENCEGHGRVLDKQYIPHMYSSKWINHFIEYDYKKMLKEFGNFTHIVHYYLDGVFIPLTVLHLCRRCKKIRTPNELDYKDGIYFVKDRTAFYCKSCYERMDELERNETDCEFNKRLLKEIHWESKYGVENRKQKN